MDLQKNIRERCHVNTNDEGTRRRWFPVQYSDDHSWIADSSYGWWPATN